jgi:hypothetical protein
MNQLRHPWPLLIAGALLTVGCHSSVGEGGMPPPPVGGGGRTSEPTIESTLITVDQLPAEFDKTRTYHYNTSRVDDPEQLIRSLWDAGILTRMAWAPVDDRCLNMIGPRFTIELVRDVRRISDFGFTKGAGLLWCATTLIEYNVTEDGS